MSSYTDSDSAFDDADDRDLGDWDDEVLAPGAAAAGGMQYAGAEADDGSAGATFRALFAQDGQLQTFGTPEAALQHTKELGCDFVQVVRRCALDPLAVIRLLNHLRRAALQPESITGPAPTPASVQALTGDEPFLHDDVELAPVPGAEMDGLLQVDFDAFATGSETAEQASTRTAAARIAELESLLHASQLACADLRERFTRTSGMAGVDDEQPGALAGTSASSALRGSARLAPARDDDTHYFTSYAGHDIHQTMISDVSRTLSYARFLLHPRNAALIRGKVVMDVGCGSGILSLFAARAGAKKVIAIDASDVAHRAAANVKDNGMDGIVEVVKGKVEELDERLKEYHGKVDLLVSEWMGYFLLYESMLPSVLHARNLYLAPTGVLAPSHCRMTLAALSDAELVDLRLHFWNDVHGFSMTKMGKGLDDEAWSESVTGDKVVSSVATIYDLPLQSMAARQPNFVSPFSIVCNKQTTVHALISWFDTWFTPTGRPFPSEGRTELPGGEELPGLPPCDLRCPTPADVRGLDLRGSAQVDPATDEEGGETVSFTTGPHGKETHWKQTLFVLKEPIEAQDGTTITGKIHVTTASDNSRELDVELHYEVLAPGAPERASGKQQVGVQTVQLFAVR